MTSTKFVAIILKVKGKQLQVKKGTISLDKLIGPSTSTILGKRLAKMRRSTIKRYLGGGNDLSKMPVTTDFKSNKHGREPKANARSFRLTISADRKLRQAMLALNIQNATSVVEIALNLLAEKLHLE